MRRDPRGRRAARAAAVPAVALALWAGGAPVAAALPPAPTDRMGAGGVVAPDLPVSPSGGPPPG
ncbi:hypothetical protein, partial [Streptomyces calidiresistens]|uniref:hypothetical protein n=1 Tax=Streptomyces calidiresistens TaxID=1485586 RepID=UPI001E2903AA